MNLIKRIFDYVPKLNKYLFFTTKKQINSSCMKYEVEVIFGTVAPFWKSSLRLSLCLRPKISRRKLCEIDLNHTTNQEAIKFQLFQKF